MEKRLLSDRFWENEYNFSRERRGERCSDSPCKVIGVSPSEQPEGESWMGSAERLWLPAPVSGSSSPPTEQGCPQGTPCLSCFFKDTSVSPSRSPQVRGVGVLVGKAVLCETKDHGGRWAGQQQLPPLAQSRGPQLPSGKDSWEVDFSVHFRSGTLWPAPNPQRGPCCL